MQYCSIGVDILGWPNQICPPSPPSLLLYHVCVHIVLYCTTHSHYFPLLKVSEHSPVQTWGILNAKGTSNMFIFFKIVCAHPWTCKSMIATKSGLNIFFSKWQSLCFTSSDWFCPSPGVENSPPPPSSSSFLSPEVIPGNLWAGWSTVLYAACCMYVRMYLHGRENAR